MKKNLLFFVGINIGIISMNAQITLQPTDVPSIGTTRYNIVDTIPPSSFTVGASGANQTWDFTQLGFDRMDTIQFIDPATISQSANFPSANLAITNSSTPLITFVQGSFTEANVQGFDLGFPLLLNPGFDILRFPSTYLDTYQDTYGSIIQTPGGAPGGPTADSTRIENSSLLTSTMDAHGIASTPLGDLDCLRRYNTIISTDSIFTLNNGVWSFFAEIIDTTWQYTWLAKNIGPVVNVDVDANNNPIYVDYFVDPTPAITFDPFDLPVIGTTRINVLDTIPPQGFSIGVAGPNQNWDFTQLGNDRTDTLVFVDPSTIPQGVNFPTAGIALTNSGTQTITFVQPFPTQANAVGFDVGFPIALDPSLKIFEFPSIYQTQYVDQAGSVIQTPGGPPGGPPADSTRIQSTLDLTSKIDAHGTTITAEGTFNSLRRFNTTITTDSIFILNNGVWNFLVEVIDTTWEYTWLGKVIGPLANAEVDRDGNIIHLDYFTDSFTGIDDLEDASSNTILYPNPAKNVVNIETTIANATDVRFYDISGKFIKRIPIANKITTKLKIDGWNAGVYLYQLVDINGRPLEMGRLNVLR